MISDGAREFLQLCFRRKITLGSKDRKRWALAMELQKAGFLRLAWPAPLVADLVVTDAGRDELAKGAVG